MISTNQFKNGNHIEVEGTIFKILEFQHVKPGKGGAFVRTKLRRSADGAVIDRTFRAGEKFRAVRTEARKMQFLYADGTDAHFMDEQSYEQLALPEGSLEGTLKWIRPNESVDLLYIDGKHDYWTFSDDLRWSEHLTPGGEILVHDCFSSIGVTLGVLGYVRPSRHLTYIDRVGSLARFHVRSPSARDRLRIVREIPWWLRNVVVKVALRLRLTGLSRALGHDGAADPY